MMLIDHIAAGVLAPHLSGRQPSAQLFGVSLVASILPDFPVVISGWKGSIEYLSHRSASHSVLVAPVLALVPLALVLLLSRGRLKATPLQLYSISFISCNIHILMDLITPFGTQIFYPLSRKQFSLDIYHSFDPIFMIFSAAVLGAFIFAIRKRETLSSRSVILLLGLYFTYLGFTLLQKTAYRLAFRAEIESIYADSTYIATIPRTFWRWKGIARDDSGYTVAIGSRNFVAVKKYDDGLPAPPLLKQQSEVSKFMSYARFPVIEYGDGSIAVHNLVYSPDSYRLIVEVAEDQAPEGFTLTGFDLADRRF